MDPNHLITVLTQGEEQAKQLKAYLDNPFEAEFCRSLAHQIHSGFETALSMVMKFSSSSNHNNFSPESPQLGSESPQSEDSELFVGSNKDQEQGQLCRKRKSMPKWSSQVKVSLAGGIEGPLDDGHSWRKYGQKEILGAKYPRGYYRCTHRHSQGCLATKQVQRSDEDPCIFDVSYRGTHTCAEKPLKVQALRKEPNLKQIQRNSPDNQLNLLQHNKNQLLSLREGLKVETEGLDGQNQAHDASSCFSFPSTPPVICMQPQSSIFDSSRMLDNNQFTASFSTNFMSPTTSGTNYFSMSQHHQMNNYPNLQSSESELTDIISAATSAANSSIVDVDFAMAHAEYDPDFHFGNSSLF